MKYPFLFLASMFIITNTCKAQDSTKYNKFVLKNFGTMFIPIGLDTFSQDIAKKEVLEDNIDRIHKLNLKKINNQYNLDLSTSSIESTNNTCCFFWPSQTILNILDPSYWSFDKDSSLEFDESKIQLIPNIRINKQTTKTSSTLFKKYYYDNTNNADRLKMTIETAMKDMFKQLYNEATITNTTSSYFLLSNKYPVYGIDMTISLPIDRTIKNFEQIIYTFYKDYFIYTIKFEFSPEDGEKWKKISKKILNKSIFL